jgi:hypothetical protein
MIQKHYDFTAGEEKAAQMTKIQLYYALLDIQKTLPGADSIDRQEGTNLGGYYRDEASVYRAELARRR